MVSSFCNVIRQIICEKRNFDMLFLIIPRYVSKGTTVYAYVLQWPANDIVALTDPIPSANTKVSMLGLTRPLTWQGTAVKPGLEISLKAIRPIEVPSLHTWVLKLENVK